MATTIHRERNASIVVQATLALLIAFMFMVRPGWAQDPSEPSAQVLAVLAPLDARAPITYYIAADARDASFRERDVDLASWALEDWSRASNGKLRFEPAPQTEAQIRLYWVSANYGQYGEMRPILVDGKRGAALYIRPDTDAFSEFIAERARSDSLYRDTIVYLTCLHELGHALGLEHTAEFDDIMFYFGFPGDIVEYFDRYRRQLESRTDIASVSGLSANDIARLGAIYADR